MSFKVLFEKYNELKMLLDKIHLDSNELENKNKKLIKENEDLIKENEELKNILEQAKTYNYKAHSGIKIKYGLYQNEYIFVPVENIIEYDLETDDKYIWKISKATISVKIKDKNELNKLIQYSDSLLNLKSSIMSIIIGGYEYHVCYGSKVNVSCTNSTDTNYVIINIEIKCMEAKNTEDFHN